MTETGNRENKGRTADDSGSSGASQRGREKVLKGKSVTDVEVYAY